uniref:Uncharacterized protein n=1 Tax=Steinernema glaseri TaxID=37863 RepID=A0A1I7YUN9_9BILA
MARRTASKCALCKRSLFVFESREEDHRQPLTRRVHLLRPSIIASMAFAEPTREFRVLQERVQGRGSVVIASSEPEVRDRQKEGDYRESLQVS